MALHIVLVLDAMKAVMCNRCGYEWTPRKAGRPPRCNSCDSRRWDSPKETAVVGETDAPSAKAGNRIILDPTVADRYCYKCKEPWRGPKFKNCLVCGLPLWWKEPKLTKAEKAAADREAYQKQRKADDLAKQEAYAQEQDRAAEKAADDERRVAMGEEYLYDEDTGESRWFTLEERNEIAWQVRISAAAFALREDKEEKARQAQADKEEAEGREKFRLKMEDDLRKAREKADWQAARAKQAQIKRDAKAAAVAAHNAWLDARWYRRPFAYATRVAPLVATALVAIALILLVLLALRLSVETVTDWVVEQPSEAATAEAATTTPTTLSTEEYWLTEKVNAEQWVAFWSDAIEERIEHGRRLPHGKELAEARDILSQWERHLAAITTKLTEFKYGNN